MAEAQPSEFTPIPLERYEVRQELGRRGPCVTYLAIDKVDRAPVAIKAISPPPGRCDAITAALEAVCLRLSKLEHPRIPRFLRVHRYEIDGERKVCLVQRYVRGKTIAQHVSEGRKFNQQEALQIAADASEALAYLHSRQPRVLHGSIQPRHVLLDEYDRAFLIDFGAVETVLEQAGVPTGPGGGPPNGYVAFEQFAGRPVPASDLYALGMTLLFAATRCEPLELAANWERPGSTEPWGAFGEVLKKLLEPAWEERIDNGHELAKAIAQARRKAEASPQGSRRRLAATLAAVALASGGWAAWHRSRPAPASPVREALPRYRNVTLRLEQVQIARIDHGPNAELAVSRLLGSERESGDVAFERLDGEPFLYFRGRPVNTQPVSYRRKDGMLVLVDHAWRARIGRAGGWLRAIPEPPFARCGQPTAVYLDEFEGVWLGARCGLFYHAGDWFRIADPELADHVIVALEPDERGGLWAATASKGWSRWGLKRQERDAWRAVIPDGSETKIHDIRRGPGYLVVAAQPGPLIIRDGRIERQGSEQEAYPLAQIGLSGQLWLARERGGLDTVGPRKERALDLPWRARALAEDGEGRLWLIDHQNVLRAYRIDQLLGEAR